jgi:hypothetical protein
MQSIRLLVLVFTGTVILCGALLMTGCNGSSSGSNSDNSFGLNCLYTNQTSDSCLSISFNNLCQTQPVYDSITKTCKTFSCNVCSQ